MLSPLQLLASFRQGSARRSAVRALRSLPAAQLADLGIAPDQIGDLIEATMKRTQLDRDAAAFRMPALGRRQGQLVPLAGRVRG